MFVVYPEEKRDIRKLQDNEKLIGLTRVLDDTEMLAQIHYVLVHPDYQGNGIAGKMVFLLWKMEQLFKFVIMVMQDFLRSSAGIFLNISTNITYTILKKSTCQRIFA